MTIHLLTPFSQTKDLGYAYNQSCALVPDGDWICLQDHDTMLLTPDAVNIMYGYIERNPTAGMLTCYTNRIHPTSPQLLNGKMSPKPDIDWHIKKAIWMQKEMGFQTTELHENISGFLMLFSKETWKQHPFIENGGCLGVDTAWWRELKAAGKTILRMDSIYIFHIYRLTNGIKNKTHLL